MKVAADNERLNGRVAAALGLGDGDVSEELLELRVHQRHVFASEDLRHKRTAISEGVEGNVGRGQDQL